MFRVALLFCFIAVAPAANSQGPSRLNKAFEKRSVKLLKEFVHQVDGLSKIRPSNDTIANVNALLNAFIHHLCNESEAVNFRAYRHASKQRPQYLVLQPKVEVGFAEGQEFDFAASFKYSDKRGGLASPMFVHKGVFGYFLSAGYYEFDTLYARDVELYLVGKGPVANFVPWVADTAIVIF
ncbi:hypothetical protein EDD80_101608 [Anseongella ginsenosidimutans]|uniref:Uncharacterized protein n=1 Tax=Anseongella ginsenosidimutans TaxID=496056 RepID=A0A4R3KY33_9SPHI|nr:hypothetical protein [Anseongella ginsenosidimutans]QEC50951.1 hypothetical protein FRZ59_00325 [Anseongella ginsenosidimutans]TCS90408.1 hypothetical protein EDD80_101608 [Anseongella ginsenosidimutans]